MSTNAAVADAWAWRRRVAAFALTMLASSSLNCVWVTYSLSYFRGVARVPATAYFPLQALFALWNAVNDPLFGWLSDNAARGRGRGPTAVRAARAAALRWGGAAWALAFGFAWAPWPWPAGGAAAAAHFFFSLCVYDAALTYVEVNHGALLAELSLDPARRAQANAAAAVAAAVGSAASLLAHATFDASDLGSFRTAMLAVAVLAFVAFDLSARGVSDGEPALVAPLADTGGVDSQRGDDTEGSVADEPLPAQLSYAAFVRQLLGSRNVVTFAAVATIQSFDCNLEKSLFAPVAELLAASAPSGAASALAAAAVPSPARGAALFLSFLLPHTLTLAWMPLAASWGVQRTLRLVLALRLVVLVATAMGVGSAPTAAPRAALLALLTNRVLSESVCRLFPLVISGLIDEDAARHRRRQAVSASLVGAATSCAKIGASLAPMVGFLALAPDAGSAGGGAVAAHAWQLLLGLPLACVATQVALIAASELGACGSGSSSGAGGGGALRSSGAAARKLADGPP